MSRLTLTGTVTDAPIANAVVTATVGSQTFTANADANGNYSLEISVAENATNSTFVTLTARGVGSQSYVEFTSLAGTFATLDAQAGSDNILSSSENFATQITNVSTAMAVLLREANDGDPVTSETLLETLMVSLNGPRMLDLAAAIKLLVDEADDYPMPAGQTSLQALLANTAAREQLVDDVREQNPTVFTTTLAAIVNDATLTRPVTTATLPATLTAAVQPTDMDSLYQDADRVVKYQFNGNGTGTASGKNWHTELTWSIAGGQVAIEYTTPVGASTREPRSCPDGGFGYGERNWAVTYRVEGATLSLLNDRILTVTEDRFILTRACGPVEVNETAITALTIIDDESTQPFVASELRGSTRTLWIHDELNEGISGLNALLPDIAELRADGSGSTRAYGKQFTWELHSGNRVLTVTFDDGTVANYRSLRDINDAATDVLYEIVFPSGQRRIDAGISVWADPQRPLVLTPNDVVGQFHYAGRGTAEGLPGRLGYRARFNADGTGTQQDDYIDANGNVLVHDVNRSANWGFFWHLDGEDLLEQHTIRADNYQFNCTLHAPLCDVFDERRYMPLVRDGDHVYWLIDIRLTPPGSNGFTLRQTGVSFYEYEPD